MANLSHEEARKFVDSIRVNNGGIEDSDRDKTPEPVLAALDSVRKQLAASTEILATDLYTKSTRFVFELIQNAEDNSYNIARAAGLDPFLRFSIYRDKIVIDSNEDGFLKENVNAICKVRASTKKGVRGYIGEKGIGFKSVFTVASKVHVQSGPFAFFFRYAGEDDGMGMVTPFNGDRDQLPNDVRTRFTLTLNESLEFSDLMKEFTDLPDTLLLFLTTLKKLQISKNDHGTITERNYEYRYEKSTRKGLLIRDSSQKGLKNFRFFVRGKRVQNLPTEKARKDIKDAEVVLAFPVDRDDIPVIEQQHVCAFLPLRKIGFPFQIQSDFITQASREDVLHSPWNKALLVGAAEVFTDAVIGFCEHPLLQYLWPKYLPAATVVDSFWAQLREIITSRLGTMPILRSWGNGKLKCIKQLKYLVPSCLDTNGEPLFRDLTDEVYLSNKYAKEEVLALHDIGLQNISNSEVWDRVRGDLISPSSRMKSRATSADWHSRSAEMILNRALRCQHIKIVQAFEMLPLSDGSWTSTATGPVFYHEIGGADVPLDLGLRILAPEAAAHPGRKQLFDAVGVKDCNPRDIKKLIIGKYAKWNNVNLESTISHMRFLFHHCPKGEQPINTTMFLFDAGMEPIYRVHVAVGRTGMVVDDVYFNTPGPYNVAALRSGQVGSSPHNIHIIHPAYMEYRNATSSAHDLSWTDWLQTYAGVLISPRLVNSHNPQMLSDLFTWIIKERRDFFLGILKTHWNTYRELINTEIEIALRRVKLKCSNEDDAILQNTFVPLPDLLKIAANLGVKANVRFLRLPIGLAGESLERLRFLETFGVGVSTDLAFYLETLRATACTRFTIPSQQRPTTLHIYTAIEERAKVADYQGLRKHFDIENAIRARKNVESRPRDYHWTSPSHCVWRGPDFLTTHFVLAEDDDYKSNSKCERLFTSILEIADADYSHILAQIVSEKETMEKRGQTSANAHIARMYCALLSDVKESDHWNIISERFEKESLIYVRSGEWHSPSECIWSDHTYIPGQFPLAKQYSALKTFFVRQLGVQSPTLKLKIKEFQALCSGQSGLAKCSQVVNLMKEISLFKPSQDAVEDILDEKIIPAKNEQGHEVLLRPKDTFVIVDRQDYDAMVAGKVATLAVPLNELRSVHTFLSALGLQTRYMSRLIKEVSKAENDVQDAALTRDFRQRAYSLMRCARHFDSPLAENGNNELFHKLKHVLVYQTSEIVKTVTLEFNGQILAQETTKGILHLETDDSGLRIYMPKEEKDQDVCIHGDLPERLTEVWSITDEMASKEIESALAAKTCALDDILSKHGISEIPDLQHLKDVELDNEVESAHVVIGNQVRESDFGRTYSSSTGPANSSFSSYVTTNSAASVFTQSRATTPELQNPALSFQPGLSLGPLAITGHRTVIETNAYVPEYKKLLGRVIDASQRAWFPSNSPFQASTVSDAVAIDSDAIFGIRSLDVLAHDMRIGAAGELFAFEMLRKYTGQSCGIEHWKSTIRHRVSVHEKYHDLAPWTGKELADIVYEDRASLLTAKLISYGFLTWDWTSKTPTYYLEVKTSTGPCDTRFFMSKAQVKRMRQMRLEPGKDSQDIYVILRVYNLASDDIGMRVLMDPATLELKKELVVEAESYTVLQRSEVADGRSSGMSCVVPTRNGNWTDQIESPL